LIYASFQACHLSLYLNMGRNEWSRMERCRRCGSGKLDLIGVKRWPVIIAGDERRY
jgi:hypothetical protein